jgi:alkylhydroperoxidase family enzyme
MAAISHLVLHLREQDVLRTASLHDDVDAVLFDDHADALAGQRASGESMASGWCHRIDPRFVMISGGERHHESSNRSHARDPRRHPGHARPRTAGSSARERAALEWTEALTLVSETHVPDEVYERVREQFSEDELVHLSLAIVSINGWNRLNIAARTVPGGYVAGSLATLHATT